MKAIIITTSFSESALKELGLVLENEIEVRVAQLADQWRAGPIVAGTTCKNTLERTLVGSSPMDLASEMENKR